MPRALGRLHPRFQTPALATTVVGGVATGISGLLPIQTLAEMVSIGTLLVLAVVCASVLVLRRRHPGLPRPFRVPIAWLICPGGVLVCIGMMLTLSVHAWIRLGAWTALGMALYQFSRMRRRPAVQPAA